MNEWMPTESEKKSAKVSPNRIIMILTKEEFNENYILLIKKRPLERKKNSMKIINNK